MTNLPDRLKKDKRWLFPAAIITGVLIAVLIVKSRPPMEHQEEVSAGPSAGIIVLEQHQVKPSIVGFGEVVPETLLEHRSEVSGKVIYVHPQLRKGAVLPANTLVIQIDDQDYQLALTQANATLVQSQANLDELNLSLQDARINLKLVEDKLAIARKELDRNAELLKKGSVSKSAYENQRSALLQQQQEVQNLSNEVQTLPLQIKVQEAQIAKSEAEVETQKRNLARTQIRLPFTGRISAVNTEENQYVSLGTTLYAAQTIDKIQINAQFSLEDFRLLASSFGEINIENSAITLEGEQQATNFVEQFGLEARVKLVGIDGPGWNGRVEQISNNLDPASRTLGVTITVDDPYKNIQPGIKPPLVEGMYTEVQLRGRAMPFLVLPRSALHEGQVYLADSSNRLHRQPVRGYAQDAMLLMEPPQLSVDTPLQPGQQLITTDLFPAIEGMQLSTYPDTAGQQAITQWVQQ